MALAPTLEKTREGRGSDWRYVHRPSLSLGRHRPTSWHIVKTPTRGGWWESYCGLRFPMNTADLMDDTPMAATCENCYRYATKTAERRSQ